MRVESRARLFIALLIGVLLITIGLGVVLIARPVERASSPAASYVFSFLVVALIFGLGLTFLFVRWLLRPYRRMVEAARGSPVHALSAKSESEFVVETFQALVEQLQAKERELAELHALERRRAERSERFSERLIANIPSGLVAIDSRGRVTTANPHAGRILSGLDARAGEQQTFDAEDGLQAFEVDYRHFFGSAPRLIDLLSECLSSGKSFRREEVDVTLADGRVRHLGLSISPITDTDRAVEGALCMMTDLTEVIELRERMKLQESLANLGEMAAGLAHEFKNSLATIHGYVQLLDAQSDSSALEDKKRQTLDATLNEVRMLARLVTDFLNFARPQTLSLSKISLRSIIDDCAKEINPQLKLKQIELKVEGDFPDLPGDETLLRSAISNLVRNAAEAIDNESERRLISITGSIDAGPDRRYANIRISDTGGGISSTDLHRIFIPFFTTKSRGYGIGLAIVQKILVAHGGDVAVEKSDNTGTVFRCRLPLAVRTVTQELEESRL
ncbi:MAG TPA: ATP-binding protein [Blastocatellia bacterium]|nr:ATP-binding protein [Blastocatellia bacterium]